MTTAPTSPDTIGEHWPADPHPPPPVKAGPLAWSEMLLAWPLVPLVPRWIGPWLARSNWIPALLVQLSAAVLLWSAIEATSADISGATSFDASVHGATLTERLTAAPRALVEEGLFASTRPADPRRLGWTVGGGMLAPWLLALALMPFIAAGERRGRLYLRAVKLLYWGGAALAAAVVVHELAVTLALARARPGHRALDEGLHLYAVIALALWYGSVIVRLGSRYSNPRGATEAVGPLARCVKCGYMLTGLQPDGRCPECGLAIAESRPDTKELPPAETLRGLRRLRSLLGIWKPQAFARRYALRRPTWPAQRIAWTTVLLGGLLVGAQVAVFGNSVDPLSLSERLSLAATVTAVSIVAGCAWMILWGMLIGWRSGRDARPGINLLCYTAPALAVSALTPAALQMMRLLQRVARAGAPGSTTGPDVIDALLVIVSLTCLLLGPVLHVLLVARGLRTARHMLK